MRVERRLEQSIAEDAEAAIDSAATGDDAAHDVAPVAPDLPAAPRIDRPSGVLRTREVDDAVQRERRRFELAGRVGLKDPLRGEAVDVLRRDLRERTVALAGVIPGVRQPARGIVQSVAKILKRDLRRRLLREERRGGAEDERDRQSHDDVLPEFVANSLPRADTRSAATSLVTCADTRADRRGRRRSGDPRRTPASPTAVRRRCRRGSLSDIPAAAASCP